MTEYQIVCIALSKEGNRIETVGLIGKGGNENQAKWLVNRAKVNGWIGKGDKIFFVLKGKRTDVSEFKDEFLRTDKDDIPYNNLRELRACRRPQK